MEKLISILNQKKAFVYTEPEIPDFSKKERFNIVIMGKDEVSKIPFDEERVISVCSLIEESIFDRGMFNIGWNLKNLFTNALYYKRKLNVKSKLLYLKIIEAYLGDTNKRPESYEEAVARIKKAAKKQEKWADIYSKIHLPLITDVIPFI